MKRITTIFALLIMMCMSTWAQVAWPTLTTDPSNPVLYNIQSYRSYRFLQYAGDATKPTQTYDCSDASTKFYFVPVNGTDYSGGVKIVSNVNGKQLNEMSGFEDTGTTWYLGESTYATGFFNISKTSTFDNNTCWDCNSSGDMTAAYWHANTEGSTWQIAEAPQYETSTLANPKWYYLKTGRGRYVYADGTNAGTNTTNLKTDDYKFAFVSVGGTGVNIVSKTGLTNGSNQYLTTTPGLSSDASTWYYFGAARYAGYFMLSDDASGYGYPHLLNDNGAGGLAKWYVDGTGSYFQVEEVVPLCEVTYTYTYGGQTYTETETQNIGAPVSLPASITFPYTNYTFSEDFVPDAATATINVTVAGFNMPFTASTDYDHATWYYAKLRGKYLRADDNAKDESGRYQTNASNERTDAYRWAFFGNPIEGIYVMNKNQGDGKYLYQDTQFNFTSLADPTADNHALFAITQNSNGGFTLRSISGGSTYYVNDAGNQGDLGFWNSASGANDGGSNWLVEEAVTSDKNALASAIAAAQLIVDNAGVPGYPNTTAGTTLDGVLTNAKAVFADATGDYASAYNTLAAAITTATAAANINYTPRTDVYYTIVNSRGAMVYDPSHSASVDATNNNAEYLWYGSTTPDNTDPNNLWGFIEQGGNYYMYNVGKQQFATVGNGTYGATWIFSNTPAYITLDDGIADEIAWPRVRVRATIATTNTSYTMSVSTSYTGPVITYDANGDGGVPMLFAESPVAVDATVTAAIEALLEDVTPYRDALKDVIDACALISFGTGVNQYTSNSTYTDALAAANTTYNDANATKADLQTAKTNLENAIAGLSLNMPTAGFYRIKGNNSGKYLAEGMASNNKFNMSDATDATTIFYFDGYQLINFGSGMSNGMTATNWAWVIGDNASTVVFQDGQTNGGYAIQSATAYFYDNGAAATPSADRGGSLGADARYRSWYLETVDVLPVKLNDIAGTFYATLCLPVDVTLSPEANAYTIAVNAAKDEAAQTMIAIETDQTTKIPANTPVVLEGTASSVNATINTTGTAFAGLTVQNDLTGTLAAIDVTNSGHYFLGKGTDPTSPNGVVPGFFHWQGTTLKAFRAYLDKSKVDGNPSKGLTLVDGEATGINGINAEQADGQAIYNLQGQRVNKAQRGIYIVGGRKVVVK